MSTDIGTLIAQARALSRIRDADAWEAAVEDLLVEVAAALNEGYLRAADYTRKTQALAEKRRAFEAERGAAPTIMWGRDR